MNFIVDIIRNALFRMLQLFSFGKHNISNNLSIYIKTNTGNTLAVDLDPKWDISNVKKIVAPRMGMSPDDIKIIFAGKELHNSTIIEECDLGQQSVLHAVRVLTERRKAKQNSTPTINELSSESFDEFNENNDSGSKPLNETLTDLSLNEMDEDEITSPTEPAHFFVYCSMPCKSIQAGKLRVKCDLCSSGAVTVDRDPQSWPDVIQPNRITVHCENDQCQYDRFSLTASDNDNVQFIPYAKFYFKCANHPSRGETDEAVPLYLIRPNLRKIPCLACTDVRENVLVFPCEAAHVICLDCFKDYCNIRLSERQFEFDTATGYYTLPCPAGCADSFIKEVHHFRILTQNNYERYQRFGAEEYVLRAGGFLCPQPDCGMGIIPPDPTDVIDDEECRKIQCIGGCGYVFCKNCLKGYHVGECDMQQSTTSNLPFRPGGYSIDPIKAKDAKWEDATTKIIQKSTKPCPKCRTPTERDGGCMHMVCTRAGCGFQWCWVCQTPWTRECMGNHWFG